MVVKRLKADAKADVVVLWTAVAALQLIMSLNPVDCVTLYSACLLYITWPECILKLAF